MPEFVLNRTTTLSGKGHSIVFRKGEPTYVPPELAREAIGLGAEPVDADKDSLLPADAVPEQELTESDKETLIFAAFDQIIAKNDSGDFGGDGKPTVDAVKRIVSFSVTKKEIATRFQKYRESKAG